MEPAPRSVAPRLLHCELIAVIPRRKIDVLGAMDKGWTNKEIGERLFVSAKTVDHHVSAILRKIDARTRGEAAAFARARGLID